jgi:hypothetical protein
MNRLNILMGIGLVGILGLTGCQKASDMIDEGKQLAADNIIISCANATEKSPMSILGINKNSFSASVMGKIVAKGDFSKASIMQSMAESAKDQPITCSGTAEYSQLQLNFKDGQESMAITAIKAYLGSKNIKLPYNVAELTKNGKTYKIVGLNPPADPNSNKPEYNPPVAATTSPKPSKTDSPEPSTTDPTNINQNVDKKQ